MAEIMNKLYLTGRVTIKPELRYTVNNIAVSNLNIAVRRDGTEDKTDFLDVQFWNKTAENNCKYLDKGCKVLVEARVEKGKVEKDGRTTYQTRLVGTKIEYLARGNSQEENKPTLEVKEDIEDPFAEFGREITEEDLPF